jgi:phytanoyl-CoA hydroxylase
MVDHEDVRRYREQGFLHVPQVLTPMEVDAQLREAERLVDQREKVSWEDETGNVMDWIADVEAVSERMRQLVLHSRVAAAAERLAGTDLRLFKSELLVKRAKGATMTPYHVDEPAFPVRGAPVTLTAWVALVDVPVEKGCMTFLSGSHRVVTFDAAPDSEPATPADRPEDEAMWAQMMNPFVAWPALEWVPRVTVPIRAGDCTFHHARTAHCAGTNASGSPRYSLATVYVDAAARFDPSRFPTWGDEGDDDGGQPAALRGLEPGAPLPDDRFPRLTEASRLR